MTTRRAFLQTSSALVATAVSYKRIFGANETLNVGLIGCGGRCRHLLKSLLKIPDTRVAAFSDIWDYHLELTRKEAKADASSMSTKRYKEVLDNKDIHAVLIASPDHWHVPMTVDACNAGKDVYGEKPLTHTVEEGAAVVKAKNDNKKIVNVGTQKPRRQTLK